MNTKSLKASARALCFLTCVILVTVAVVSVQLVAVCTIYLPVKTRLLRFTASMYGCAMFVLTWLFCPLEMVLTGDHALLNKDTFAIVMANHQLETDWWYIWVLGWFKAANGSIKMSYKESLSGIPGLGTTFMLLDFIPMARRWEHDKHRIRENLSRAVESDLPLWFLIFPEGTVVCDETIATSKAYAAKNDLAYNYKHLVVFSV